MIKKLRRNFILVSTSLASTILLIVVIIAIAAAHYFGIKDVDNQLDRAINEIKKFNEPLPNPILEERDEDENRIPIEMPNSSSFAVKVDESGTILTSYNIDSIDEETLNELITYVLSSNKRTDDISSYEIRYQVELMNGPFDNSIIIGFASLDRFKSMLQLTFWITIPAYFLLELLLLLLNFFLSRRITKPVKDAFDYQQQFIADASHDLKTPLTVIMANNEIITSHQNNKVKDEMKWIESTQEEAIRMRKLVESLLETAKTSNMKDTLLIEETNLSFRTESYLLQIEPIAFEKGCTIETHIEQDIIWNIDQSAYLRLLAILIDNAIKYSDPNTPIIISLNRNRNTLVLSVTDYGQIIGEEDLANLFKRFYRAEKARSTEGYGLGLAIASGISEALNGKISCKSNQTDGTVFQVVFKKNK